MDVIAHIFYQAAQQRLWLVAGMAILLTLGLPAILMSRLPPRVKTLAAVGIFGLFAYAIVNIFTGPDLAAIMVHHYGIKGTATITGSFPTGDVYNDRPVNGFNVLIRTATNKVIESSFTEEDFNVYPVANAVDYPGMNDVFTVYYLASFPNDFVIVTNDDSPWAHSLRCADLRNALASARAKYAFDSVNRSYKTGYVTAAHAFVQNKCSSDDANE